MLYCIVGPSGCGKTTIVNELIKRGYKAPDSYTTRPPRYDGEKGHTFISQEEFNNLKDLVAYTHFDGNDYGVTKEMLNDCDIYIVDPAGVESLIKNNYTKFEVIGLYANAKVCYDRMKARGDSEQQIYNRLTNDYKMFKDFKKMCNYIIDTSKFPMEDCVNKIENYMYAHNK